ncbi:Binding-protein-dependent transport systems inner membrane component [Rhodopseudomonas palustris HaA2]|uniref:Binding-protein-dependent transport systems inner membrane component n=1 Tax=Rhodopseudomonas palustris (strain HaA2) TaxID=316058 RepID=Q2J038_RHOP2|nr:iron ABC transporter permease [Rhodopseudomonas palustris]ABD06172.1 Binding-protein-dependent transport systems inner membrane component [Rhodopseudomonas palustris HaA2]
MRSSRGASRLEFVALAVAVLTALIVAAPVISLALTALQPAADVWPHLLAYVLPQSLRDTAWLLLGVGGLTLLIGTATAWLVSSHDFVGRTLLVWLLPLPLAVPTYLSAYVYVDLFEPLGLAHRTLTLLLPAAQAVQWLPNLRSLPGAVGLLALVLYPYVYLSARAVFQAQSADAIEAARSLGAGRLTIWRRVVLPMARPALAVGVALAALETLNDIGASEYLGVRTLTVSVFTTWLNRGSLAGAAQISLVLLGFAALLITIERIGRRHANVEFSAENPRLRPRTPLHGAKGGFALLACLLPALLGFVVPAAYLVGESLRRGRIDPSLARDALHTVALASVATVLALALGLIVVLAARWRGGRIARSAAAIVQLGYALPGLVLALGLLMPLLALDGALVALAQAIGLASPGLLLMSSGGAVVAAYVIRFLAVPTGMLKAGFQRIPRDYDDSARAAGAGPLVRLSKIDLPLLRPALVGAAILVFVDCLKELPATLLLRPLNVETLSTSIYQYASRGSFEEGALAALIIVAASIPPVIWLTRFSDLPE